MNHKQFLEKYQPDCFINIIRPFGRGEPIRIVVKAMVGIEEFKESAFFADNTDIIKGLDECCDRIHRNVRLYKNPSLGKRLFPFLYK